MSQNQLGAPALVAVTVEPTVKDGLGYPNHRDAEAKEPTGWQGSGLNGLDQIPVDSANSASSDK